MWAAAETITAATAVTTSRVMARSYGGACNMPLSARALPATVPRSRSEPNAPKGYSEPSAPNGYSEPSVPKGRSEPSVPEGRSGPSAPEGRLDLRVVDRPTQDVGE